MSKFKEGDKVRLVKSDLIDSSEGFHRNDILIVDRVEGRYVYIHTGRTVTHYFFQDQLELVEAVEIVEAADLNNLVQQIVNLGYKVTLSKEQ